MPSSEFWELALLICLPLFALCSGSATMKCIFLDYKQGKHHLITISIAIILPFLCFIFWEWSIRNVFSLHYKKGRCHLICIVIILALVCFVFWEWSIRNPAGRYKSQWPPPEYHQEMLQPEPCPLKSMLLWYYYNVKKIQ